MLVVKNSKFIVYNKKYKMSNEFDKSAHVYELNITNFRNGKDNDVKVIHPNLPDDLPGIIFFYHHWCPYCQMVVPTWNKLSKKLKGKAFVSAVHGSNEKSGNNVVFDQLLVSGVPDIRFLNSNHMIDNKAYEGERTVDEFIKYINKKDTSKKEKSKSKVKSKSVSKKKSKSVSKSKKKVGGKRKKVRRARSIKRISRKKIVNNYRKNNKIKK